MLFTPLIVHFEQVQVGRGGRYVCMLEQVTFQDVVFMACPVFFFWAA